MRPIIGDEEYRAKAIALMTCLSDPQTYTKEVTVCKTLVTPPVVTILSESSVEDKEENEVSML